MTAMEMRVRVAQKYGTNSEKFQYFQYVFSHRDMWEVKLVYHKLMGGED